MDTNSRPALSMKAGSLTITVAYDGVVDANDFGQRHQWSYRLVCSASDEWEPVSGADLYLSPVAPNSPQEAMRTLLSFLTACGESYSYAMRNPSVEPEDLDLFPSWVPEAAYLNSGELEMLALELEESGGDGDADPVYREGLDERDEPGAEADPELAYAVEFEVDGPEPTWPPATLFDVVFLQGEEGYDMVDFIDEHGVDAAIERLSGWDFGTETMHTALFHGHVYDEAPSTVGDHTAESGPYVLTWHAGLGHVNLLRRFGPGDEPPAWWPDRVAQLSPVTPPDVDPGPPAQRQVDGRSSGPTL
jgi:hypothetical protein